MATAAQLTANLANAQLSTGPRSEEGKQASSRNATSHGMCSREFVILPGEQEYFDQFMAALEDQLAPAFAFEEELFRQAAHAAWTLRRVRIAEAELLRLQDDPNLDPLLVDTNEAKLKRLDTYAKRAGRAFHRAVQELRTAQTERQYRNETHTVDEYPDRETCIRGDSPLVGWLTLHPQLARDRGVAANEDAATGVADFLINLPPSVYPAAARPAPPEQP